MLALRYSDNRRLKRRFLTTADVGGIVSGSRPLRLVTIGVAEDVRLKLRLAFRRSKGGSDGHWRRETVTLIGSDKVEGTSVYGANDTQIGSIERVMIDKRSGKVSYAVPSFGGFLGIGDDHYPIPWNSLKYDTNLGGYRSGITESSCKVRQSTATTTNGVGKIRPARGRSTITTGSSLPEPTFPQSPP